jgi:uncharacterized protein YsxB (DUF464 family)
LQVTKINVKAKGAGGHSQSAEEDSMHNTSNLANKSIVKNSGNTNHHKALPTPQQLQRVVCAAVSEAVVAAMLVIITSIEEAKQTIASKSLVQVLHH